MRDKNNLFDFTQDEIDFINEQHNKQQSSLSQFACKDQDCIRQSNEHFQGENAYLARPPFVVDVEKILHNPFYSRCADKTQVFSLVRNDDITRRSFHLQIVSRVGRTIGAALGLNLDLIEAIAVGHDLGHTPFGHKGEELLSKLYYKNTKRYFNHNVHSVRLLKTVTKTNLSLQTYSGIIAHCGEKPYQQYEPQPCLKFSDFETQVENCYTGKIDIHSLKPNTLEGCVVRYSDIIAYLGKDRQDAQRVHHVQNSEFSESELLGKLNYEIIRNITRNIIKNSIDKPYLAMDSEVFDAIKSLKAENDKLIYYSPLIAERISFVEDMMSNMYERFLEDITTQNTQSPIFRHHVNNPFLKHKYEDELESRPDDIVVDFIASMTDDYFIELYKHMFPNDELNKKVKYVTYF